ncbi:MAG: PD40 domain-containing protein [Sedimentisphaerales bacterium]|nr:PD40 domain-containing protein [Sedimentisphaerales bacterium]
MRWLTRFNKALLPAVVLAAMLPGGAVRADFVLEEPVCLGPIANPDAREYGDVCLSADGREMYYSSIYPQDGQLSLGGADLWMAKRSKVAAPWGRPQNVGPVVNSDCDETEPYLSADGLKLLFASDQPGTLGNLDIWMTTRDSTSSPWKEPVNLGSAVNSAYVDGGPCLCDTCMVLFFHSDRNGGMGGSDLYMVERTANNTAWSNAVNLGLPVNSPVDERLPRLEAEECALSFYCTGRFPEYDAVSLWQSSICHVPIVDLNGDGYVTHIDIGRLELCQEAGECWADTAPGPFGNGVVDGDDLALMMTYWRQEVEDPTLLAHWKLDEYEGDIAYNSVGDNHGRITGAPCWLCDGGREDGGLELDGIDDLVVTDYVVNPAEGPFSVLVWVLDGGPGQGIITQRLGATWLATDAQGALMTALKGPGGTVWPLHSDAVITDGRWHRLVLVCEGGNRILYVDSTEVARDDRCPFQSSEGGLVIGGGLSLEAGTLWSGMIDDIRIYNRAVKP